MKVILYLWIVNEWIDSIEKLKNSEIRSGLLKKGHEDFLSNYTWFNRTKKILNALQ